MQDSFDVTTLVFIALAVFVAWKLRSVLGQKTGQEKPTFDPLRRRMDKAADAQEPSSRPSPDTSNVVRLPGADRNLQPSVIKEEVAPEERWAGVAAPGTPLAKGLDAIAAAEPDFQLHSFLDGARSAYEMIITAYAAGDVKTLKPLLAHDVYEGFESAIQARMARGETAQTTFVSIDPAEITGVHVQNRTADVTLRFASKMITVTRDKSGAVTDGHGEAIIDVTDIWTFSRVLGTQDPNWHLSGTQSGPE